MEGSTVKGPLPPDGETQDLLKDIPTVQAAFGLATTARAAGARPVVMPQAHTPSD